MSGRGQKEHGIAGAVLSEQTRRFQERRDAASAFGSWSEGWDYGHGVVVCLHYEDLIFPLLHLLALTTRHFLV